MYVKEISKTTKNTDKGADTKYKMVLEQVGDDGVKISIVSEEEFEYSQGEKNLDIEISSTQTKLV